MMPLTADFRETLRERAARDPAFRAALLQEAVQMLVSGDIEGGRAAMRDYIEAIIGFRKLKNTWGVCSEMVT